MHTEYEIKNFQPGMKVYLLSERSGSVSESEPKEHTVEKVGRKYITIDNGYQYSHEDPDEEYLREKTDIGWKTYLFRSEEEAVRYQEKEQIIKWFTLSAVKTLRSQNVSLEAMKKAKAIIEGTEE